MKPDPLKSPREFLAALFAAAIAPDAHGGFALPPDLLPPAGKTLVIAAGKAASAHAAELAPQLKGPWQGLLVAPHGYTKPLPGFEMIAAGHPVPDDASLAAASRALSLAQALNEGDRLLLLLSGGGSALLCAPAEGVSAADKRALTTSLLRSGASIGEMNAVRKHLSRIKGGRLAAAAFPAETVTLAMSDVPGDDPATIASGPSVADPSTLAEAREVLARYGIAAAPAIADALHDPRNETPKADDVRLSRSHFRIIARPADALAAAERTARAAGCDVLNLGDAVAGESRLVAKAHAQLALRQRPARPLVILSGSELTVTLCGDGVGGPNREYALALAMALNGADGIHALAADTDGIDGARDAAGAFVAPDTLARGKNLGLSAAQFLARNDAGGFFAVLGDALETGPTFTNLNDFRAILVMPDMIRS
ncbi:MAG TPA: DUF4147 domain-containing protein [Micropepsaceae bacterium]|nr:DUF4147 domain-containing protein [Micropepsaceae bacterium]